MRVTAIVVEAARAAWSAKIPAVLIALVAAAMSVMTLITVGQQAATAANAQARLVEAGARTLSVTDTLDNGYIFTDSVRAVAHLSTVETAVALSMPFDTFNGSVGQGGRLVPAWRLIGSMGEAVTLVRGRWPQPGEALISETAQQQLGLSDPVGFLETTHGDQFPIVGEFAAVPPFDDLSSGALIAGSADTPGRQLRVVVDDISDVQATQQVVLATLAPPDPASVSIQSPSGLAETATALSHDLSTSGRTLMLIILAAGAFFVAAVVFADTLIRRRDVGRRRTLGATRGDVAALVSARAIIPAGIGGAAGAVAGWLTAAGYGHAPPVSFSIAVAMCTLVTTAVATLPPALIAARRDPVRVMRTP